LTLRDGTDKLSRNVGTESPLTLRNITEEPTFHLHRDRSLKSHIMTALARVYRRSRKCEFAWKLHSKTKRNLWFFCTYFSLHVSQSSPITLLLFSLILLYPPVISTLVLLLLQGQLMVITFRGWGMRVNTAQEGGRNSEENGHLLLAVS